ncbi:MAG: plasmid pRiA4b ORF-3 family protein [Methanosarcinaceae archaeon]|nr:plasmid pRiA4b ORF-3 family protein [Methanosarcinaceae archaeon]
MINWYADAVIEEETNDVEVYLLKVTLAHSKPPIWRRILVMGDITLSKFHLILQTAMGWSDSHPHMFLVDGEYYGESDSDDTFNSRDERTVKLSQLILEEGNKFSYMYDFGDSWEHDILVEKILTSYPDVHYPLCVKGKRACPPEDCGGIGGYHYLLDVLEDPDDLRYVDMIEWIGWDFDPNDFDIDDINVRLSLIE